MRPVDNVYLLIILLIILIGNSEQHGSLIDPPARNSAWLVDEEFKDCCSNYNFNEMNCGGTNHQWETNGGKCGVCGEPWDKQGLYTKGGEKYLGKIMKTYEIGSSIDVHIKLTANHLGVFEFRLCNLDKLDGDVTQDCLNKTVLKIKNTQETQYILDKNMDHKYSIQLPSNLRCSHCVLQWKWIAAKDWGTDANGVSCMGCGLIQETSYNCADISIQDKKTNDLLIQKLNDKKRPISNPVVKQETKVSDNEECKTKLKFGSKLNFEKIMNIFCSKKCGKQCNTLMKALEDNLMKGVNTAPTQELIICMDTCPIVCNC